MIERDISKVVIVDDDEVALDNLKDSLSRYSDLHLEGTAMNGAKGKKLIMKVKPDFLFLDVELPDVLGVRLLSEMRDDVTWNMKVVFYTAYDKYLLDALRESAFDYLLKPYATSDLDGIIERYRQQRVSAQAPSLADSLSQFKAGRDSFLVSTVSGFKMLRNEEIGIFEYENSRRLWEAVLFDGSHLPLKRNTKAEDIVEFSSNFVQISQSVVINMTYLALIDGHECVLYPPFNDLSPLTISRGYMRTIQERFCLL